MNIVLQSSLFTLNKSRILLSNLSDEKLSDVSIPPYFSSVGSHIRHILDFYDCIFNVVDNEVDLTARKRNLDVENCCNTAICYLDTIINKLEDLNDKDVKQQIVVIDDLGLGKTKIDYTFAALLAQANSHTIHHYAIISYILDRLGVTIEDATFGYNPTTPKQVIVE
ncbi:DinB family protein [Lacinutrix himadriensis]|uniref:DinB family protein n=1 Tax=Lacinutrix himadriensis TaxID=641549 RepID=UPI0006E3858B|nr:DinB family protein [Lacinutrix himadriensis]